MIDDTLLDAEERMDKALSVAREDLGSVRTGRAAPSMFNKILVDYYGAPTPVPQMASITVPEARISRAVWSRPIMIPARRAAFQSLRAP